MIVYTNTQAFDHLILSGWLPGDAYDVLADEGIDPHRDAPMTLITDAHLALICAEFMAAYA